jgi:hypothetical protein
MLNPLFEVRRLPAKPTIRFRMMLKAVNRISRSIPDGQSKDTMRKRGMYRFQNRTALSVIDHTIVAYRDIYRNPRVDHKSTCEIKEPIRRLNFRNFQQDGFDYLSGNREKMSGSLLVNFCT